MTTPGIAAGVSVLLRASGDLWREPVDATLLVDGEATRDRLCADLDGIRDRRPRDRAPSGRAPVQLPQPHRRRRRARASRQRGPPGRAGRPPHRPRPTRSSAGRGRGAAADRADAEQIVDDAAARLERLLDEVRAGVGAAHRQLRRPRATARRGGGHRGRRRASPVARLRRAARDDDHPVRAPGARAVAAAAPGAVAQAARGRARPLAHARAGVRGHPVVFPASLDKTFGALRRPTSASCSAASAASSIRCSARWRARSGVPGAAAARASTTSRAPPRASSTPRRFFSRRLLRPPSTGSSTSCCAAHQRWIERARVRGASRAYGVKRDAKLMPRRSIWSTRSSARERGLARPARGLRRRRRGRPRLKGGGL